MQPIKISNVGVRNSPILKYMYQWYLHWIPSLYLPPLPISLFLSLSISPLSLSLSFSLSPSPLYPPLSTSLLLSLYLSRSLSLSHSLELIVARSRKPNAEREKGPERSICNCLRSRSILMFTRLKTRCWQNNVGHHLAMS